MIKEIGERKKIENIDGENGVSSEKIPASLEYLKILEGRGLEKQKEAYKKVIDIVRAIKEAGGRALLVGGSVRDMALGATSKDFDIEIYNLPAEEVEQIAKKIGKVSDVGKAFGILKITFDDGVDIDISLPRMDSKIGVGHRGFEVKTDPAMSVKEAARRRDFTINSMAADPLTGEIFDFFGGIKDLRERRLKITDDERFRDDPLRVLRAMQFIGRFGLEVDPKSADAIRDMASMLKELPKERLIKEWEKLLLLSEMPSIGLSAGMALDILKEMHPEITPLKGTEQEKEWHPEGDVWVHTLMAVDEAARIIRRENLDNETALVVMFSTLAHDFGKPSVTEFKEGRLKSHGHEEAGLAPTRQFLETLGVSGEIREKVEKIIANHLKPSMFYIEEVIKGKKVSDGTIRRLARRIHPATIYELVLCAEADHTGRGPFIDPRMPDQFLLPLREYPARSWLLKRARRLDIEKSKPVDIIQGRDLIALGHKPGPHIGKIIQLANQLRDDLDYSREVILQEIFGIRDYEKIILKLQALVFKENKE